MEVTVSHHQKNRLDFEQGEVSLLGQYLGGWCERIFAMLKASDLFTRICLLLEESGYSGWTLLWSDYSTLVTLNRPIQKSDVVTLKHEITEAHKWVEGNVRIARTVRRELLTLLGLGGRCLRLTNISKVNGHCRQDGSLIERYQSLLGTNNSALSGSAGKTDSSSSRLVGAPPKSKKNKFVRASTPNRAAKTTKKGTSRKTVASGKFRN
jgi:hypothetical protein